ncbi:hypothetical protein [Bacillus sp. AFS088145]|uniref:hypothetical protein n=1 Tax=Bacillus sp. AFS088145 TaxID=2033514 RepID=UPI0015CEFED8|nr:hypothetical protein [Bacillus sp. AFS088145]
MDQHSNHFDLNNDEIKKAIEPVEAATKTATEDIETIYKIYNKCWESWKWDLYYK